MRKRYSKSTFFAPTSVYESMPQTSIQSVDGSDIEVVAFIPVDTTSKEVEKSLPDAKSMKLSNLLKAGIPLVQLTPSTLFNPTDVASVHDTVSSIITSVKPKTV